MEVIFKRKCKIAASAMMKIKEGNYVEFWMTESRQPCRFEKEQSQEKEYSRAGMRVACSRSRKKVGV